MKDRLCILFLLEFNKEIAEGRKEWQLSNVLDGGNIDEVQQDTELYLLFTTLFRVFFLLNFEQLKPADERKSDH